MRLKKRDKARIITRDLRFSRLFVLARSVNICAEKMDIKNLMERYKVKSAGSLRTFVAKHLSKINATGKHAIQTKNGWHFDSEAVKIIDDLRGYSIASVVEELESEKVKDLQAEIDNLKTLLLVSQSKVIKLQEELSEKQTALAEAQTSALLADNKKTALEGEISNLKNQIDHLQNRNLFQRIFNIP